MRQLFSQPMWWFSNQGLLKNFGIVTPNIVRNLRYFLSNSVCLFSMRVDSDGLLLTPTPSPTKSLATEPSWPSPVLELGTPSSMQSITFLQVHC